MDFGAPMESHYYQQEFFITSELETRSRKGHLRNKEDSTQIGWMLRVNRAGKSGDLCSG